MGKTFLLGLGAQKAGTTWVHAYLARSAGFAPGLCKEYHVLDRRPGGLFAPRRLRDLRSPADFALWRMERSPRRYVDHFAALLEGEKQVAADITPSYCTLAPSDLLWLKQAFADRGIAMKALFIARDPVARCASAVRMNLARGGRHAVREGVMTGADFITALRQYYPTAQAQARTRYERTIARIEQCFAPHEMLLLAYEDMFSAASIGQLSAFTDVENDPHFGTERVFSTGGEDRPDPELRAEIAAFYADTYAFCAERLPQTRALWGDQDQSRTSA